MKVLCVHGIGRHDPSVSAWQEDWKSAISQAVRGLANNVEFSFCLSDQLFSQRPLTLWQAMNAIATLGGNAIFGPAERGLFDGDNVIGWTAGMVMQWAGNEDLRKAARQLLRQNIRDFQPNVIVAHSLGSLIAYDLFSSNDGLQLADGQTLVTIGSQINNRFVSGTFERGVIPLRSTSRWFHIYNSNDHVFTAPIQFDGARNFREVMTTPFGSGLIGGHTDLTSYMNDPKVLLQVWNPIVSFPSPQIEAAGAAAAVRSISIADKIAAKRSPQRRALLIGINEYNNPEYRLEGCVNDVFEVSSLLQECDFSPDEIRVVFDERATAAGIRERLDWLFDDTEEGDVRFLFYSGHGTQMPIYGQDDKPSRLVEALVAADFDGTLKNCITDKDLAAFYGKMRRGSMAIIALDCCNSGGMTRSGSPRVRGIDPPDDIRHRMLRWDSKSEMWVQRDFPQLIPGQPKGDKKPRWAVGLSGESGTVARIGSSIDHRRLADKDYDHLLKTTGWKGAFQPLIITACKEDQKSAEYLHGASSYGAFTFAFCRTIRRERDKKGKAMTFEQAVRATAKTLKSLEYNQEPELSGPDDLKSMKVPFLEVTEKKRPAAKKPRLQASKPVAKKAVKKK
jgi:metacaspase-1